MVRAAVPALYQELRGRPAYAERLIRYYDLIAAAGAMANPRTPAGRVVIELDPRQDLPHLRQVYIEPAQQDAPGLIVVGAPGDIQPPGAHPVLRRLQISYSDGQAYPRLLLKTLSRMGKELAPQEQPRRLQKSNPRYDIEIYSFSRLLLGYVRTSIRQEPIDVAGPRVGLRLALRPGDRLLCTSVYDAHEAELLRCVRVLVETSAAA
jgi:hypothetical protein